MTQQELIDLWATVELTDEYFTWIRAELEKAGLNSRARFKDMSPQEREIHAGLLRQWKETQ